MKLAAICQRSVKRDYVDLHAILTTGGASIGDLVSAWNRKYPGKDVGFALGALGYFTDVDKARMPEMISKTTWEKVKTISKSSSRVALRFDPMKYGRQFWISARQMGSTLPSALHSSGMPSADPPRPR